jgi:hypothetical protein
VNADFLYPDFGRNRKNDKKIWDKKIADRPTESWPQWKSDHSTTFHFLVLNLPVIFLTGHRPISNLHGAFSFNNGPQGVRGDFFEGLSCSARPFDDEFVDFRLIPKTEPQNALV